MQAEERQKRIEEYMLKTEFASLDELSEEVDASVSTVRRDLAILEGRGAVRRTHGGARLVGPLAVEAFSKIRADAVIMSAGGLSLDGVSNSHGLLIEIQRAMIHAARQVIFCFDHTKFGRESLSTLCEVETIDTIVTDKG